MTRSLRRARWRCCWTVRAWSLGGGTFGAEPRSGALWLRSASSGFGNTALMRIPNPGALTGRVSPTPDSMRRRAA
ncbi:MAG: hypothetical protein JST54_15405 [Deltaproteobacteria bacterium]|nr:hypothetical protein [Deltaproteobacteria bacterium]